MSRAEPEELMLALAPQNRELPASLLPAFLLRPKLFRWPYVSSSTAGGPAGWPLGLRAPSEWPAPIPTPNTLAFSPLPTPPRRVPRTNPSSQTSTVKGLLYVPGAAGRGLVASHCPGPAPKVKAQPARTEEEGGMEGLAGW